MTNDERIVNFKYRVLEYVHKHKNISSTCKAFNLSRAPIMSG